MSNPVHSPERKGWRTAFSPRRIESPRASWLVIFAAAMQFATIAPVLPAQGVATHTPAAAGMVDINSLVPDIALDMRYAGSDNFVGERIDGYQASKCYLLRPAAQALARVETELRGTHMRLKVFDCYRPARAVRRFVEWARDERDQRTKPHYYPRLDKRVLLGAYIAPVSGHSRGATIDLTLERCAPDGSACAALDMGTDFDFFDPRAHTDSADVSAEQRANRGRLRSAMEHGGFRNYAMEWWHFTLSPEPMPRVIHDVPIR